LPYLARLEKAGIPTVVIDFEDQTEMVKQTALVNGIPNVRYLHASRVLTGPEDVDNIIGPIMEALTEPLTDKEKETGRWEPPQQRILFEGTLDEAETFYQKTTLVPFPINAPISVYTDGLPIRVPTEERVREMLTGTRHKPDELITYQSERPAMMRGREKKKGDVVEFEPMKMTATVEKVATIAVMAGCKPEHLPAVLAIAESSCSTGTTVFWGQWVCISGPYAKEIGMNVGAGMIDPGSPVNMPIGRAYQLIAINLGGATPGVNRMNSIGSPFNSGGTCFAENADGLPAGWKGLNEEYGFKKDESVAMVMNVGGSIQGGQFSPGGYRALQKSGHGGIARRLDVKGTPGPHNFLEYLLPGFWASREGGITFVMVPEMAQHLHDYGFKTKDEVYEWVQKRSLTTVEHYKTYSWPDIGTNGWLGIEPTSGKHWKELADDYLVPLVNDPRDICIIVGGGEEEVCQELAGRRGASSPVYSIDAWR
jgi:hypothetical protein